MGLIIFDVVMRYVLRIPFLGAYEISEVAMALIVFLALPYCAAIGGHVSVDLLSPWLDRPGARWTNVLVHLAGAGLTALMGIFAAHSARDSLARGEGTNMLAVPIWPFELVTSVSMLLFSVVLLIHAWRAASGRASAGKNSP